MRSGGARQNRCELLPTSSRPGSFAALRAGHLRGSGCQRAFPSRQRVQEVGASPSKETTPSRRLPCPDSAAVNDPRKTTPSTIHESNVDVYDPRKTTKSTWNDCAQPTKRLTKKRENVSLNVCTRTLSVLSVRGWHRSCQDPYDAVSSVRICDHREDYTGRAPGSHQREHSSSE
jgi:hypothetical protein